MTLTAPLNDKECLTLLHDEIRRTSQLPSVQALAAEFGTLDDLVEFIQNLEQRDDIGDPTDGPRLPCQVTQRARFAPSDPNCFERVHLYHTLAEIIDPVTERTTASLVMDNGWHTFPVEIRDGLPQVVVLDPISPPRNAMAATAYQARRIAPSARIVPWFQSLVRNACTELDADDVYQRALSTLRNSLISGEPIDDPEAVDYVLTIAAQDAELWGARGRAACDRVARSVRNLSITLDRNRVNRFVSKLIETGEKMAPKAIKTALIAQYGPAAAIALEGVDVALAANRESESAQLAITDEEDDDTHDQEHQEHQEQRTQTSSTERLRRMTLAFR